MGGSSLYPTATVLLDIHVDLKSLVLGDAVEDIMMIQERQENIFHQ